MTNEYFYDSCCCVFSGGCRYTNRGAVAAMITGGIIGVVSFLAGIPGPFSGMFNSDLGLFIAYSVSLVVIIVSKFTTSSSVNIDKEEVI